MERTCSRVHAGQIQRVQILQAELERLNPDDPALRQAQ